MSWPVDGLAGLPVITSAKVMTNGDTIFTFYGDILIQSLFSECITSNGAAATTLQYSITPSGLAATPISGASATLASATAGTIVTLDGTALSTAPVIVPAGVGLGQVARGIIATQGTGASGIITLVIGTGPTTGTWKHYLRYLPLEATGYVKGS